MACYDCYVQPFVLYSLVSPVSRVFIGQSINVTPFRLNESVLVLPCVWDHYLVETQINCAPFHSILQCRAKYQLESQSPLHSIRNCHSVYFCIVRQNHPLIIFCPFSIFASNSSIRFLFCREKRFFFLHRFQASLPRTQCTFSGSTVCHITTDRSRAARTAISVFPEKMYHIILPLSCSDNVGGRPDLHCGNRDSGCRIRETVMRLVDDIFFKFHTINHLLIYVKNS